MIDQTLLNTASICSSERLVKIGDESVIKNAVSVGSKVLKRETFLDKWKI
tara:strand:+ start:1631 stop:1780 length:150 start_codon:yes stop_codon:yes gene_type:complete